METNKPIIFFSHSSKDKVVATRLKNQLKEKTQGTFEIFVSSDGQSIPFGRNWVNETEKALTNSKIMFVLLSPNSLPSSWIYFESGYAYSKGIEVIPVGILGVDLSQIPAPISLLQGFNINSTESLNNVISTLNRVFGYSLQASFSDEEYADIFNITKAQTSNILKEYTPLVDEIRALVDYHIEKPIDAIAHYFTLKKVEYQYEESMFDTYGLSIIRNGDQLSFAVDPNSLDLTIPLVEDVFKIVMGDSFEYYPLTIDFVPSVNCIEQRHKRTSKIYKSEITIFDSRNFGYFDIAFDVGRNFSISPAYTIVGVSAAVSTGNVSMISGSVYMQIKYYGKNLAQIPIYNLLKKLFDLGILY